MNRKDIRTVCMAAIICAAILQETAADAQQMLTLEQCREMAVSTSKTLQAAEKKKEMASYDKKAAMAAWFPEISIVGTYQYNSRNLSLLSEDASDALKNTGNTVQGDIRDKISSLLSDPVTGVIIQSSPELLAFVNSLGTMDIAGPLNALGAEIDNAFTLGINNVFAGAVTLTQPIFTGGKIISYNKIAALASDLAGAEYDAEYQAVLWNVEQAWWQTISLQAKVDLAQSYADLLHMMEHDVQALEAEGMATGADVLSVKVKVNEADMLLTKAGNGLILSKMLLCKLCGLPPESDIMLAYDTSDPDFSLQEVPVKSDEEIFAARPEIRSLGIATEIYSRKVAVARSDMMPKIALTGNYIVTSPNLFHGFSNRPGGFFNVGVTMQIPIIHGCEAMQKTRKAKAEAEMTRLRLEEAKEMISLQVASLRKQDEEAIRKMGMALEHMDSAEENLRTATVGFNEGVIPAQTLFAAQTAWLQAHSEYIDAGISMQLSRTGLLKAYGDLTERHGNNACPAE